MSFKKIQFFIICTLVSCGLVEAAPTLTVFMHGTVGWYLAFASPTWFKDGHVESGSWYHTLLEKSRSNPDIYERSMMLEKGFQEVSPSFIEAARKGNLSRTRSRFAAYYMIAGYDTLAHVSGFASEEDHYALFGWSGMNSQVDRLTESFKLYSAVVEWCDTYEKEHGVRPAVRINAYSHAGNVALGLFKAEERNKRGLVIEQLCLFATPIQLEMTNAILSPMFKSIVLLRSPEGDHIQTIDSFSTHAGTSFASMSEIVDLRLFKFENPMLHRADVGVWVNKNGQAVDHFNFFELEAKPLHAMLDSVPVVVLAPLILQQINYHPFYTALRARILCDKESIRVQIKTAQEFHSDPLSHSDNHYTTIASIQDFIKRFWKPKTEKLKATARRYYENFIDTLNVFDSDDDL